MRIERIKIDAFGLFSRGVTVEFGDAPIAVVLGDNESGKTTMMEAIVATIFGFSNPQNEESRRPWREHESYSCTVTLRLNNSSLIEIARNFADNAVRMRQLTGESESLLFAGKASPRSRSADADRYAALLEDMLGLRDATLFMASVFVRQEHLQTELSEGMRRAVSGAVSTDYEKARTALTERFFKLTKHNPWGNRDKKNDREIEELQRSRIEIAGKLDTQREAEHSIADLLEQEHLVKDEIEQIKRQIHENESALHNVAEFNRLNKEKERARERETALRRELENVRETKARIQEISKELKEKYPDFDSADMPFQQLLVRAAELEDEEGRREQAVRVEQGRLDIARQNEVKTAGLVLAIVMSVVGGVVGFVAGGLSVCLAGVLVGGALGYLLPHLLPSLPGGKATKAQVRASMFQEDLQDIRERRERVIGEIEALCGTTDVAAISVQFEEYRALQNQLNAAESLTKTHGNAGRGTAPYGNVVGQVEG
jgi:DNA repair exonuclease SbcCD ATPase subunit